VAKRIGELLVEAAVLSQSQLEQALFAQRKDGRKLGQLLIELGLVSEVQLTQTLSRQLSVAWVSLYHVDFSRSLLNLVPREIAEQFCLVPVFVRHVRNQGDTLYIAMDDPTNDAAIDEVSRAGSLPVMAMIACGSDIRAAIRVYYLGGIPTPPPATRDDPPPTQAETPVRTLPTLVGDAPAAVATPPSVVAPPVLVAAPTEVSASAHAVPPPLPAKARAPAPPVGSGSVGPSSGSEESSSRPAVRDTAHDPIPAPGAQTGSTKPLRPRMMSLTLLDGTTVMLPAPPRKAHPSRPNIEEFSDQLTGRDLVSALRAVAHGADASEILGGEPRWEAMFSALLSVLLRKGLIADWEFIEEFRKI
jgi:type IV pilus assembly protein PilB